MGFFDFLRDLFGGDQKPAAPPTNPIRFQPQSMSTPVARNAPAQAPRQYASPAPPQSFAQPQGQQFFAQPQGQQMAPWRAGNFPAQPAGPLAPLYEPPPAVFKPISPGPLSKEAVQTRKTAETKSKYFGDEAEYAPEQMSVDAYLQLAPRQRAAVDANTALIAAAEQDVASWAKQQLAGKPIEDKNYLSQVEESFGDKGGSDTYAPRTMTVLEDLGLNLQGKDLDQYLNYSALVTADDLKGLTPGTPTSTEPRQQNAVAFSEAATNRLSATLAAGQNLLDNLRTGSDTGTQLFGSPATTDPIGFTNSERDADLQQAFDILSQTRSQQDLTPDVVGGLYTELQTKHNITPNEVAQYFDTRLQANEYLNVTEGTPVSLGGAGTNVEYLTPEDFRTKFLKRGE